MARRLRSSCHAAAPSGNRADAARVYLCVAAGGPVDAVELLYILVDRLCRLTLAARGWRAVLADTRAVNGRALRLVSRALIADTGQFAVAAELTEAMAHIATECSLITRRAEGEPPPLSRGPAD